MWVTVYNICIYNPVKIEGKKVIGLKRKFCDKFLSSKAYNFLIIQSTTKSFSSKVVENSILNKKPLYKFSVRCTVTEI